MGCLKLNIENPALLRVLNGGKSAKPKSRERSYWFGYNGMEKDPEMKGDGNSYTTEFRQYDPRLGRWLSLDPLMTEFPWMSPYVAFNNSPIFFTDPTGLKSEGDPVKTCVTIEGSSTGNNQDNKLPENFKLGDEHTVIFTEGSIGKVIYTNTGSPLGHEKSSYGREGEDSGLAMNTCFVRKFPKSERPPNDDETGDKEEVTRMKPACMEYVPPQIIGTPIPTRFPTLNINIRANFNGGSSRITNLNTITPQLHRIAYLLRNKPNSSLTIFGDVGNNLPTDNWSTLSPDTDNGGTITSSRLALNRAAAITRQINRMGVPNSQLNTRLGRMNRGPIFQSRGRLRIPPTPQPPQPPQVFIIPGFWRFVTCP